MPRQSRPTIQSPLKRHRQWRTASPNAAKSRRRLRDPAMVREAAIRMITLVLRCYSATTQEDQYIRGEVLTTLVWKRTEAVKNLGNKRCSCPYWSARAFRELIRQRKRGETNLGRLHVDHVRTRRAILEDLCKTTAIKRLGRLFSGSRCVLLISEHKKLRSGNGWLRYRGSGILVARISQTDRQKMADQHTTAAELSAIKKSYDFRYRC
jgi:hypothetical protein